MRKASSPPSRPEAGFTLIEVTMALAILAVMVTINYKMIMNMVETKIEIDDRRDGMFMANSVLARLTRELQLAGKEPKLPPPCDNPTAPAPSAVLIGQDGSQSSNGQGASLTFSAKEGGQYIPDGGTHSGAVQISYRVEQDPEQKGNKDAGLLLIRDEIPNRPPYDISCKDVIRFPITNNLVNFELRFFDNKTSEWSTSWEGTKAANLPDIIQFTLWLRSEKGRVSSYTSAVKLTP